MRQGLFEGHSLGGIGLKSHLVNGALKGHSRGPAKGLKAGLWPRAKVGVQGAQSPALWQPGNEGATGLTWLPPIRAGLVGAAAFTGSRRSRSGRGSGRWGWAAPGDAPGGGGAGFPGQPCLGGCQPAGPLRDPLPYSIYVDLPKTNSPARMGGLGRGGCDQDRGGLARQKSAGQVEPSRRCGVGLGQAAAGESWPGLSDARIESKAAFSRSVVALER